MKNAIDITDLTDAALDVVLEVRSGNENVPCDHLTAKERYQVAEALGYEMNALTRYWINSSPASDPVSNVDYEGMILARQEEEIDTRP